MLSKDAGPRDRGTSLVELIVALLIITIVLSIAVAWLISANRAEGTAAARSVNNAAAQGALNLIDVNVRFASAVDIEQSGQELDVTNGVNGQTTCTKWYLDGAGDLIKQSRTSAISPVATGISGLTFKSNSSYSNLISVSFNLNQAKSTTDRGGVTIYGSYSAINMPQGTSVTTGSPCQFTG